MERVSWNDCQKFLEKVNKRIGVENVFGKAGQFKLPHEDQWEYACRGGKGNKQPFYFGNELNGTQANCNGKSPYGTDMKRVITKREQRQWEVTRRIGPIRGVCARCTVTCGSGARMSMNQVLISVQIAAALVIEGFGLSFGLSLEG